jgi:hypothetical protein
MQQHNGQPQDNRFDFITTLPYGHFGAQLLRYIGIIYPTCVFMFSARRHVYMLGFLRYHYFHFLLLLCNFGAFIPCTLFLLGGTH